MTAPALESAPSPLASERFALKLFLEADVRVEAAPLIATFHRFIQERRVEGLLVDVAVYDHVLGGPGIMLIAHEANYAIDEGAPGPGLLVQLKRGVPQDAEARFRWLVRAALGAAVALEAEPALGYRFDRTRLSFRILDRLVAAQDEATFARVAPTLTTWAAQRLGPAEVTHDLARPKGPFAATLRFATPFALDL